MNVVDGMLGSLECRLLNGGVTHAARHLLRPAHAATALSDRRNFLRNESRGRSSGAQQTVMASMLKVQTANAAKASAKSKGKRKADGAEIDEVMDVDGPAAPKRKRNKQRVLLLSSRGITHRMRHLMNDLEAILPHVKKGE